VAKDKVSVVYEDYEPELWAAKCKASPALPGNHVLQLRNVLEAIGNVDSDPRPRSAPERGISAVDRAGARHQKVAGHMSGCRVTRSRIRLPMP
jgi:hypothetical protein